MAEPAPGHPEILRILAPNPSPMTGAGTNTYVYGNDPCVVIDPGVDDPDHLAAIKAAVADRGGLDAVLISHDHPDHTGGAGELGAPVIHPRDGERYAGLLTLSTPGHAHDHVCFVTESTESPVCFSADLILGEGSTVVLPGGGSLTAYLESLRRIRDLEPTLICPGHGPWILDPIAKIDEYIEHRLMRERALVAALERGERSQAALLDEVWHDAPPNLRAFAALVMQAHMEKLEAEGRLPDDLTD